MKTPFHRNTLASLVQLALLSTFAAASASATTYTVTSTGDSATGSGSSGTLRYTLGAAMTGDTINFNCTALGCPVTLDVTSLGNNGGFPGPTAFSIIGKSITLAAPNPGDVTLKAHPGSTSATSMRLFFIDTGAALSLTNVTLSGGRAIGGNGGAAFKGTGGGAAGLGGAIFSQGSLTMSGVRFAGNGTVGGNSLPLFVFGDNFGGGGGLGGDGGGVCSGGGGGTGGDGGICSFTGQPRGNGGQGGAGLGGQGGGSPGGYNFGSPNSYNPGPASLGGGGGGAYLRNGISGSEGGGGGSSGAAHFGGGFGGAGGFGGGGGGNYGYHNQTGCTDAPGAGGFGGGAGSGCRTSPGGVGGGDSGFYSSATGASSGAGAAFGGALFVRAGTLTVHSASSGGLGGGNTLNPGTGAHNGAAAGRGLFLMSGVPATFDVAGTYTVTDSIADDSATAVPPGHSFGPGTGVGANLSKSGAGTLVLDAVNTYAGTTVVTAGTLAGSGSVAGPVTLASGAMIAPGDPGSVGTLTTGALTWSSGGVMNFDLGASSSQSDRLNVNGVLGSSGAGTYKFHFGIGSSPPVVGQVYTLIQASGTGTFAPGDFAFDTDAAYQSLAGTFGIVGNAVQFTVTGVASDHIFRNGFE